MSYKTTFDLSDDIIDVRDIIERVEVIEAELDQELEAQETTLSFEYALQDADNWPNHQEEYTELIQLLAILGDIKGYGGDEQWRGDWYPATLIRESHFNDYIEKMVYDCYDIPELPSFMSISLDYVALRQDYSTIDINGVAYWFR